MNQRLQDKHLRLSALGAVRFMGRTMAGFGAVNRRRNGIIYCGTVMQPRPSTMTRFNLRPIGPFWFVGNCALIGEWRLDKT